MGRPDESGAQRSVALAVIAILAIPVASVSLAALIAGGAASTDGSSTSSVLMALAGVLVGLGSQPMVRRVVDGVIMVTAAAVDHRRVILRGAVTGPPSRVDPVLVPVPVSHDPRASLRRRGPPVGP